MKNSRQGNSVFSVNYHTVDHRIIAWACLFLDYKDLSKISEVCPDWNSIDLRAAWVELISQYWHPEHRVLRPYEEEPETAMAGDCKAMKLLFREKLEMLHKWDIIVSHIRMFGQTKRQKLGSDGKFRYFFVRVSLLSYRVDVLYFLRTLGYGLS